jgi:hypothetical protein
VVGVRKRVLVLAAVVATFLLASGLACSTTQEKPQVRKDTAVQNEQNKKDAPKGTDGPSASREQAEEEKTSPELSTAKKETRTELAEAHAKVSPGYKAITDDAEALSVEVPSGWEHLTGIDSEVGANWSDFGGEGLLSSITASADLDAWHKTGRVPGTYVAASRTLAQTYSDDELVASGPNDFSYRCEAGVRRGFERPAYYGRLQAWKNCDGNGDGSAVTLVAAPEDRDCVVLLQVIMYGEDGKDVGQHIIDSFEANCGRVTAHASSASASTSASPAASASASAAPGLICDKYGCVTPEQVAQQKALAESGTEAWWPGSGIERPQPNNCAATETQADGC